MNHRVHTCSPSRPWRRGWPYTCLLLCLSLFLTSCNDKNDDTGQYGAEAADASLQKAGYGNFDDHPEEGSPYLYGHSATSNFCSDLDNNGQPLVGQGAPLHWGKIEDLGAHWSPAHNDAVNNGCVPPTAKTLWEWMDTNFTNPGDPYCTPDDASRYPSYKWISANFTIDNTIRFLVSIFTNMTEKMDSLSEDLDADKLKENIGNLTDVDQSSGMCFCTDGCSPSNIENVANDFMDALYDNYVANGFIDGVIDDILDSILTGVGDTMDDIEAYITGNQIGADIQDLVAQALADAVGPACNGAVNDIASFLGGDTANDLQDLINQIITKVEQIIQAVASVWDSLKQVGPQLKDSFETLKTIISSAQINGLNSIMQLDWGDLADQFQQLGDEWKPLIEQLQNDVTLIQNNIGDLQQIIQNIINNIQNTADSAASNVTACIQGIADLNWNDFWNDHLLPALESWANDHFIQPILDLQNLVSNVLNNLLNTILQPLNNATEDILLSAFNGCISKGTKKACNEACGGADNANWLPTDFQNDPAGTALFLMDQAGFLDAAAEWIGDNAALVNALSGVAAAAGEVFEQITEVLEMIFTVLQHVEQMADQFTEGYHIGAYDNARKDLHMCIGYAGHGAYAQFGKAGGKNFSIGARYASNNLSKNHRAQMHRAGIAISVLGKELALAPGVQFQTGIDGWKAWNAEKPFGIPMGLTFNPSVVNNLDVFNVVPEDDNFMTGPMPFGAFFIKDMFPVREDLGAPSGKIWPRLPLGTPELPSWERRSAAVLSAGLNLELPFPREGEHFSFDLPEIQLYPLPTIILKLKLTLRVGVGWYHETNMMRDIVQEKLNENIASQADKLTAEDFARDMHRFQAPDVTQDDGNHVYVEPGIEAGISVGIKVFVPYFLIDAGLGYSLKIDAAGIGGVADLNAALAEYLVKSNPPKDADCLPILEQNNTYRCNNDYWESEETYSCDPKPVYDGKEPGSCCIVIQPIAKDGSADGQGFRACIDEDYADMMGMDKNLCESLNIDGYVDDASKVLEQVKELLQKQLEKSPDGILSNIVNSIESLLSFVTKHVSIEASWGDMSCGTRVAKGNMCGKGRIVDLIPPFLYDGGSNLAHSECEIHGACINERTGEIVANDVTEDKCEKEGLRFQHFNCTMISDAQVTGWEGDGCHPLDTGFVSACGCETDAQCASGETCQEGSCIGGDSCICDTQTDCSNGRICIEGACAIACSTDSQCAGNMVCESGGCLPPFNVPTAEQVIHGMRNVEAPGHLITSYAMSQMTIEHFLRVFFGIRMGIKIFGKKLEFRIWDYAHTFPLKPMNKKTWYQPGLEAYYQSECADPSLSWDVTNRYPKSITGGNNSLLAAQIGAQPQNYECSTISGGTCRYPQNAAAIPSHEDPNDYTAGNAGDVDTFLRWCLDDMPKHVSNPDASTPGDIFGSINDTINFGHDVGVEGWNNNTLCINGEPYDQWFNGLAPTIDGNGDFVDEGWMGQAQCEFTDPNTNAHIQASCASIWTEILDLWGCTSIANAFSSTLPGALTQPSNQHPGNKAIDIVAVYGNVGDPVDFEFTRAFDVLRHYMSPNDAWSTALLMTNQISQCIEANFVSDIPCACQSDDDCTGNEGICENGFCQEMVVADLDGNCYNQGVDQDNDTYCIPTLQDSVCSPIQMIDLVMGPCCGDGIVQNTDSYTEQCDPNDPATPNCNDDCTMPDNGTPTDEGPEGACCTNNGCLDGIPASLCSGEHSPNTSCETLNYCQNSTPSDAGSCCLVKADGTTGCYDGYIEERCISMGGSYGESQCAQRTDCGGSHTGGPGANKLGSCCARGGCFDERTYEQCKLLGGQFSLGISCDNNNMCNNTAVDSCCIAEGCFENIPQDYCTKNKGNFEAGVSCDERTECTETNDPDSSCCLGDLCIDGLPLNVCSRNGGIHMSGISCSENTLCGDAQSQPTEGSCCYDDGCAPVPSDIIPSVGRCEGRGGTMSALSCEERTDCQQSNTEDEFACCTKGKCDVMTEKECTAQGGTPTDKSACTAKMCLELVPGPVKPIELTGSCCHGPGACSNNMKASECNGSFKLLTSCEARTDCEAPPIHGACCNEQTGGCFDYTTSLGAQRCESVGTYYEGLTCADDPCNAGNNHDGSSTGSGSGGGCSSTNPQPENGWLWLLMLGGMLAVRRRPYAPHH